jgi:hypothetical protein
MRRAGTSEKRMVFRARLILVCATGVDNVQVAKTLGTSRQTVTFWRGRFLREGMGGLAELARSGRPERIKSSLKGRILSEAVRPPGGVERWSTRSMAKHVGVSKATVQRVWSTNDIKPHRTRIFKLSCDKQFEVKFWDVIGVYLDPPDNAVVLCTWNQNATSGTPTAKKFSTKYTEHGKRLRILQLLNLFKRRHTSSLIRKECPGAAS